jgi:hypothetical protein
MRRRPGNSILELPYLYTFGNEIVGQAPSGWRKPPPITSDPLADFVVVDAPTDILGIDPNRNCLYFNTTATDQCRAVFDLPGSVDVTGGIRMAWWWRGEADKQDAMNAAFLGGGDRGLTGGSGLMFKQIMDLAQNCLAYGYIDGVYQGSQNIGNPNGKGYYWLQWQIEWNPTTGTITGAIKRWSNSWHTLTVSGTLSFAAPLAAAFQTIDRVEFYDYKQANVYCRDMWVLGFWIGNTTDAYPAIQMPLSL